MTLWFLSQTATIVPLIFYNFTLYWHLFSYDAEFEVENIYILVSIFMVFDLIFERIKM